MTALKIVFWISLFIIFYSYIGYGILLYFLIHVKSVFRPEKKTDQLIKDREPQITLVVSAYNEQDFIEKKINNTLGLDYPEGKLRIIFITDGSSDRTPQIIGRYPQIQLLHQPERRGKLAAMNRAMQFVTT